MVLHACGRDGVAIAVKCTGDGQLDTTDNSLTNNILLTSSSGIGVYADTQPVPTADINNRPGWLHSKPSANTDKFNYYFYSQGSHPVTLGEIKSLLATLTIDTWTNSTSAPFFVIYTKPTGIGDAGAWYHSKRAYAIDVSKKILLGESVNMYCVNEPSNFHNNKRAIELSTKIDTGSALDTEQVLTVSLQSDSSSGAATQILVQHLGFELTDGNSIHFNLLG